jgi:hypothetical protein
LLPLPLMATSTHLEAVEFRSFAPIQYFIAYLLFPPLLRLQRYQ